MEHIRFYLNDRLIDEREASPTTTLLEYLRRDLGLTGTKEGCAEGDCGACTVAVIDPDAPGGPTFRAINSCLVLLPMVQGRRVYTVEGLAQDGRYHPAQEAMVAELGSQCGYCTPGVVMTLFEACYRRDLDAGWKLDDQLCGNLCRCTGYRPIREAAEQVAGLAPDDAFSEALRSARTGRDRLTYAPRRERFYMPRSFEELWSIVGEHPDHRFVCGATDLGLDVTKRHRRFPCLVSLEAIGELRRIDAIPGGWSLGAGVNLADLEAATASTLPPIARMLRFFGSRQIKNRATLGGNLCNASPIGDTAPVLLSLGATAVVRSRHGERHIPLDQFFVGYRETALEPGEILARVEVPEIPAGARAGAYKVSKRRELDISTVCAGMLVRLHDDGTVADARLGFGGMAATSRRAARTEAALIGQPWTEATVTGAAERLAEDFAPIDDHRGSAWYRGTVARNLLLGFYLETRSDPVRALPDRPTATVLAEVLP